LFYTLFPLRSVNLYNVDLLSKRVAQAVWLFE
jgi:hypothetical protein